MSEIRHGKRIYRTIMQKGETHCYLCGKPFAYGDKVELHHVMNGAFRMKSEVDGLVVLLHDGCHRNVHGNPNIAELLKKDAERAWLEESIEKWVDRYGRNYL